MAVASKVQENRLTYQVFMTDGRKEIAVCDTDRNPTNACRFLEEGGIIFFPQSPFKRSDADTKFLLEQKQEGAGYRKNIAYYPDRDEVTGVKGISEEQKANLCRIMSDFSQQAQDLVRLVLTPYTNRWKIDLASYRPIEEKSRPTRLRARNDLLHVDSFSTRITNGNRIMRVFENINPSVGRIWRTSDTFAQLAEKFASQRSAPKVSSLAALENLPAWNNIAKLLGLRLNGASAYDRWMLDFHNFLKENNQFQTDCRKDRWEFPPHCAWIVFTDMVSHSVLSGQYALEQTFMMAKEDMVTPQMSPINILQRLYPTANLQSS